MMINRFIIVSDHFPGRRNAIVKMEERSKSFACFIFGADSKYGSHQGAYFPLRQVFTYHALENQISKLGSQPADRTDSSRGEPDSDDVLSVWRKTKRPSLKLSCRISQ